MTHDRSTGGDDTLFADLERELGGGQGGSSAAAPSDDPLAELARLIEESRGAAPSAQPKQAQPQQPQQPQQPAAPRAPAPQQPARPAAPSYGDDIALGLEESLRGMDFSSDADPFAQPGDMSSDMAAPAPQPKQAAPAQQPPRAPAQQIPAPQPAAPEADDPFASLESALSRVVADAPAAAPRQTSHGLTAAPGHNPYAAHTSAPQYDAYDSVPEPGIQYDEGAPEFADAEEGASPYDETGYEYEENPRSSRGMYVVGALIGLVVVGGAAAYGFKSLMGGGEDNVPLVTASDVPAKTIPEPSAQQPAQQGKLVYDRIGGNGDDTANSQIMPREEQVAIGTDGRSVRVISGDGAPPAPTTGSEGEDSRRVRTLTVRPDGQIETPPPAPPAPSVAQQQPAPQTAPTQAPEPVPSQVATNTGGNQRPPNQLDVVRQNAQREAQSQGVPLPLTRPAPSAAGNQQSQTPVAVAPIQIPQAPIAVQPQRQPNTVRIPQRGSDDAAAIVTAPARRQAPAPVQQQANIPVAVAPSQSAPQQQTQVASVPRQQAPRQAAPITSGYVVQVASSRSEADAQSALSRVQGQAGGALSGYQPQVQRADLGTRGIFYRAAFGPMQSMSEATSVCNKLKSSGVDCFVR